MKEANTALHAKMVNMETNLRKEMHEKIAKDFEPSAGQAAVGKAISDFNEGKTSKSAVKIGEKKKVAEAETKVHQAKYKKDFAKLSDDKKSSSDDDLKAEKSKDVKHSKTGKAIHDEIKKLEKEADAARKSKHAEKK